VVLFLSLLRRVSLSHPSDNVIKVNVDGSSIGNPSKSRFEGLLRNSLGGWIIGFVGSCGHTTNIDAELRAISYGLRIT